MRILMVNYEYPPLGGGGGVGMMEVANELSRQGHEVHVLTSGGPSLAPLEEDPVAGVTIHRAPVFGRDDRATASFASMFAFLPSGMRTGNRLLRQHKFDVINTWFAIPSGITGTAIARKNRVPHLLTIIGGDIYDPSKSYSPHQFWPAGAAVKWVLKHADAHVAISSDIASRARRYFGFDREIEVIPLGVPEPEFRHVSREQLGMDPGRKYVVAVGRLVRRKDYPTLLRALKALDRPDTDLLLIGDGPEKENLLALARELGIEDRVQLRGFVEEETKYQILENSDLFVLASLHEGFGVVYLEAMYCGLPVIAADEGGQTDLLEEGKSGRLVPIGDVETMAAAMGSILSDAELREAMGRYNAAHVQDFAISKLAARYGIALQRTIEASRDPGA